jgi:ATP-dependent Clp protease adaptor protein ClpS
MRPAGAGRSGKNLIFRVVIRNEAKNPFVVLVTPVAIPTSSIVSAAQPQTTPLPEAVTELRPEGMWRVVVLNDPVNLMSYVVMVFKKVFGYDESRARKHMLEVHEQGRSVVWSGLREKAEAYVFTLQQWHLTAILEPDETH